MNFKRKTIEIITIDKETLERKIEKYLSINSYRIVEKGRGYVIFEDDKFSDRVGKRSDFYNRIGEGKFKFEEISDNEIRLELIYFTSVSLYMFIVLGFSAFGIYVNDISMPIVISIVFLIPFFIRIGYLNANVFKELLKQ